MWDECRKCRSIDIKYNPAYPYDRECKTCGSKDIESRIWESRTDPWNAPYLENYLKQSGETIDGIFAKGLRILGNEVFPGSKVRIARGDHSLK